MEYDFINRQNEANRVLEKYPDRVPVIVYRGKCNYFIDKEKYLVPNDMKMGEFMVIIRKRLKLFKEEALFLFVGNTIPSNSKQLDEVYELYKDNDGFLYVSYNTENVFGGGAQSAVPYTPPPFPPLPSLDIRGPSVRACARNNFFIFSS